MEMSCLMVSSSSFSFLATAQAMNGLTFARVLSAKTCTLPGAARYCFTPVSFPTSPFMALAIP